MPENRMRCAVAALATVPMPERYLRLTAAELVAQDAGHDFHNGAHMGWAWGEDRYRGCFLDFLWEHRMTNMRADRFFANGTSEPIVTPASSHLVTGDPTRDAEIERTFFERNDAAYESLRQRGLLPDQGANVGSQDINEFLLRGGMKENPDD